MINKKIDIKNRIWHSFDNIIANNDPELDNILIGKNSSKINLIYVAYKALYGAKPLHIIFW